MHPAWSVITDFGRTDCDLYAMLQVALLYRHLEELSCNQEDYIPQDKRA